MDNKNNNTNEEKEQKAEEIHRITVSRAADEALDGIVERINDGFDGGRVNRMQAASWIVLRSVETFGENEIKDIRADHFDEVAMLESVLRRAKKTGKVPSELKALLQKHIGLEEPAKKRKKQLQDHIINDDMVT